jgi:hypothetical protein
MGWASWIEYNLFRQEDWRIIARKKKKIKQESRK